MGHVERRRTAKRDLQDGEGGELAYREPNNDERIVSQRERYTIGRNNVERETEDLTRECRERSGGELKRKRSRVRFLGREPGQSEHGGRRG